MEIQNIASEFCLDKPITVKDLLVSAGKSRELLNYRAEFVCYSQAKGVSSKELALFLGYTGRGAEGKMRRLNVRKIKSTDKLKECGRCGHEKNLNDFHKKTSAPDTRQQWCKACMREVNEINSSKRIFMQDLYRIV